MSETDFRRLLADNLIYYRKRAALTQAEVAAHINYSDKSVSKWERGEGCPDVYVLTLLAELYGVSVARLTSPRCEEEPADGPVDALITAGTADVEDSVRSASVPAVRHSPFTVLLAVGGVWLVATIIYSVLNMVAGTTPNSYLAFIYAIPASFAMVEAFAIKWRMPSILHLLFSSGILWTLMVSIHLTALNVENIYLIYVIAAVAQLLGIFGLGLYWQMIRWPQNRRMPWRRRHKKP